MSNEREWFQLRKQFFSFFFNLPYNTIPHALINRHTPTNTPAQIHPHQINLNTANVDLLKMVPVEILLNFGNYFRTFQLGFWKFLSGIVFLHHYVRTIGLFFSQAHLIWPKPRAFNPDRKYLLISLHFLFITSHKFTPVIL